MAELALMDKLVDSRQKMWDSHAWKVLMSYNFWERDEGLHSFLVVAWDWDGAILIAYAIVSNTKDEKDD